jgi:hypothetical protein
MSLSLMAIYALALAGCLSLIFRFRIADWEERQQLKWFGLAALAVVLCFAGLFTAIFTEASGAVRAAFGWTAFISSLGLYGALAVAILKYRLYEMTGL